MKAEQVSQVAEAMLSVVRNTLVVKNQHYASGTDKLWNFKTQAAFEGRTATQVNFSHMMKQLTTMLKASNNPMELSFGTAQQEGILQKPIDVIAYAVLWVCNQLDEQYKDPFELQDVLNTLFPKQEGSK